MSKKLTLSKNSILILVITTVLAGLSATLLVFFTGEGLGRFSGVLKNV